MRYNAKLIHTLKCSSKTGLIFSLNCLNMSDLGDLVKPMLNGGIRC